jgi:hypothetical protein
MSQLPVLYVGGLSGRVFLTTRYHQAKDGTVSALDKFDVTSEFEKVAVELGWTPPKASQSGEREAARDD